eukprot:664191-Pleurochrysis_carterae.AAC.2
MSTPSRLLVRPSGEAQGEGARADDRHVRRAPDDAAGAALPAGAAHVPLPAPLPAYGQLRARRPHAPQALLAGELPRPLHSRAAGAAGP